MPYLVHFYPIFHQKQSFFQKTNSKSSKLQGFWINSRALGKKLKDLEKKLKLSSFKTQRTGSEQLHTRYHKSVKKKPALTMTIWRNCTAQIIRTHLHILKMPWPMTQTTLLSFGWKETSSMGFLMVDKFRSVVITLFFSQKKYTRLKTSCNTGSVTGR